MADKDTEDKLLKGFLDGEPDGGNETIEDVDDDETLPSDGDEQEDGQELNDDDDGEEAEAPRREREVREPEEPRADTTSIAQDIYDPKVKLEDKNGDLYHNGKLIARAGRERKHFEAWRRRSMADRADAIKMATRLTDIAAGAKVLFARYNELKDHKNAFDTAGFTPQDQQLFLEVGAAYKKNPIEGLKLILTKAQMAGVDIKSLGVNSFDPSVVINDLKKHFDEKFKPISEQTAREAETSAMDREAKGFFDRNPEARDYAIMLGDGGEQKLAGILAEAKRIEPTKHLDELWNSLYVQTLRKFGGRLPRPATKVVDDRRGGTRRSTRLRPRRTITDYNGTESYEDIGKDILADIQRLNPNG